MMRLPWFEHRAPKSVQEAARILTGEGPNAMLIAGGTDLLPNMKRRQMAPKVLVSLKKIEEMRRNGATLGAGTTLTDLGVWNIFLNPDMSNPQAKIRAILCDEHLPAACPADSVLLDEAIARFKTPGLRDLGHSAPYMHNGQFVALENAVGFYLGSSSAARAGTLRNDANALRGIALIPADIAPLVAFLKSLNEDYQ